MTGGLGVRQLTQTVTPSHDGGAGGEAVNNYFIV
jgi:hypothetical protein